MTSVTHVLVLAKAPVPGRVKTRLCPPCSPAEAAGLAAAALADTLDAVAASGADRKLVALDGAPGDWLPSGFEVFPQEGAGFDERLEAAWAHAGGPGLQIGMDTPQITADDLDASLDLLAMGNVDAVLGDAEDGGWWAIGLTSPVPGLFLGVPMSAPHTARAQRRRLEQSGLRTGSLSTQRDVDSFDDALAVAAMVPSSRFAAAVANLTIGVA